MKRSNSGNKTKLGTLSHRTISKLGMINEEAEAIERMRVILTDYVRRLIDS